jgi:hypothetical protein
MCFKIPIRNLAPGYCYTPKIHLSPIIVHSPQPETHSALLLAGNVRTRHWMKINPMTPVPVIVLKLQQLASEA